MLWYDIFNFIFMCSTSGTNILYVCDLKTILIFHNHEEMHIDTNYLSVSYKELAGEKNTAIYEY